MTRGALRRVVIGVGNDLRGDDAFGLAVIRELRDLLPDDVAAFECDGEPSRLLDLWQGADLAIVVDCARGPDDGPGQPGHIYRFDLTEDLPPTSRDPAGTHGLGLGTAISLADILGRLPPRLILYAVQGRAFTLGTPMSPDAAVAIPDVVSRITAVLREDASRHTPG